MSYWAVALTSALGSAGATMFQAEAGRPAISNEPPTHTSSIGPITISRSTPAVMSR